SDWLTRHFSKRSRSTPSLSFAFELGVEVVGDDDLDDVAETGFALATGGSDGGFEVVGLGGAVAVHVGGEKEPESELGSSRVGGAVFVSCAEQFLDEEGIYRGSVLDYHRQDEFEARYRAMIDQIAAHAHSQGFYGPMGADIMTDRDRKRFVVDLNVRLTGDFMMGPLRGHFLERWGLGLSYLITPLVILGNRDQ
ncbi:MAG: hypothetical protein Q9181_004687, partial [Wetmoreana brouardii]